MKYNLLDQKGKVIKQIALSDNIFNYSKNSDLLIQKCIRIIQNNARQSTAHTKTRADVSGGGKKPWKQKGTGRARHGSSRSPIWKGGGVTFGPRNNRKYNLKMNKKEHHLAYLSTLSKIFINKKAIIIDKFNWKKYSTKSAITFFKNVSLDPCHKNLIIFLKENKFVLKNFDNIVNTNVANIKSLSIFDMLYYSNFIFEESAINLLQGTVK